MFGTLNFTEYCEFSVRADEKYHSVLEEAQRIHLFSAFFQYMTSFHYLFSIFYRTTFLSGVCTTFLPAKIVFFNNSITLIQKIILIYGRHIGYISLDFFDFRRFISLDFFDFC